MNIELFYGNWLWHNQNKTQQDYFVTLNLTKLRNSINYAKTNYAFNNLLVYNKIEACKYRMIAIYVWIALY